MIFNNYKIGQKVIVTDCNITAEILDVDLLSQQVQLKTLEDCTHKGKLIKAGLEVNMPESYVKPYILN